MFQGSQGGGPNFSEVYFSVNKFQEFLFIKKLVPRGNNCGGSIFTMTGTFTLPLW